MKRLPSRCASTIQIVRPSISRAETQPRLQPALLSLSAMISQYFIEPLPFSSPDEFPKQRSLEDRFSGLSDLRERGRCRKRLADHCDERRLSDLQFSARSDAKGKLDLRPAKYNFAQLTPLRFCQYFRNNDPRLVASRIGKGDVKVAVLLCSQLNHATRKDTVRPQPGDRLIRVSKQQKFHCLGGTRGERTAEVP